MVRGVILGIFGCGLAVLAGSCLNGYEPPMPERSEAAVAEDAGSPEMGAEPSVSSSVCTLVGEVRDVSQGRGTAPSIAWTGTGWLVAYHARDAGTNEVRVAVLGQDGSPITEHVVDEVGGDLALPQVHATNGSFTMTWQHEAHGGLVIRARALALDGKPLGQVMDLGTSDALEARPVAATLSSGLAVAWMDKQSSQVGMMNGQGMGPMLSLPGARHPGLAAFGDEVAVAWSNGAELAFGRTTSFGAGVSGVTVRSAAGEARLPRITFTAFGDALVAWEDTRSADERIYLAKVDAVGNVSAEERVEDEEGSANWPDIASMGSRTAVAYYQYRGGPSAVYLAIFDETLAREGDGIQVSGKNARFPTLAWSGKELGVAWAIREGGIQMTRLACD